MQNPNGKRQQGPKKPLTDTEAGRNAAIDWEWMDLFFSDLQSIMRKIDWRTTHYLGRAVAENGTVTHGREVTVQTCMTHSFANVNTLITFLKENEDLICEAKNLAQEKNIENMENENQN